MCTLTFVPTDDGYLAGMNRDELLSRPPALSPLTHKQEGMEIAYPQEPSGGTWIACNSRGNLLALLNWNEIDTRPLGEKRKTRGFVIPELILEPDSPMTDSHVERLSLDGVFPFRLIGTFRTEKALIEWQWDGDRKRKLKYPWARKHWFSSSLSDECAAKERGRICETSASKGTALDEGWLRSLHRSHEPALGPFSICVHRADAATVSYTEVKCSRSSISMNYLSGNACLKAAFDEAANLNLSEPEPALNRA